MKQIYQYTMDGDYVAEYKSIRVAARKYNITPPTINVVLKGRRKSAAGYRWSYVKTDKMTPIKTLKPKNGTERNKRLKYNKWKIETLDNGLVYRMVRTVMYLQDKQYTTLKTDEMGVQAKIKYILPKAIVDINISNSTIDKFRFDIYKTDGRCSKVEITIVSLQEIENNELDRIKECLEEALWKRGYEIVG